MNVIVRKNTKKYDKNIESVQLLEEQVCSLEEQREALIKTKTTHTAQVFSQKLKIFDKKISIMKCEIDSLNLKNVKDSRKNTDKIVLDKKIPSDQFTKKIDLSGKCDEPDPSYQVITDSRKYYSRMSYNKPPPEIEKKDPKHFKNFGNKPLTSLCNFKNLP
jgi:hypothetical protein